MAGSKTTLVAVPLESPPLSFSLLASLIHTKNCGSPIVVDFSYLMPPPFPLVVVTSTTITFDLSMSLLPTTINIGSYFSSLMVCDTYCMWKSQFLDVFAIHDLQNLIASDARPPPSVILDVTSNPTHSQWLYAKKLLLTWIKSTVLSTLVQSLLLSYVTTFEAWSSLDCPLNPIIDSLKSFRLDHDRLSH